MKKGKLNRRIKFERATSTKDPVYGTSVTTWKPFAGAWAEVQDVLPSRSETLSEGVSIQRRPARVRMGYRSDITSDMRVIYQGRTLEIVSGPAELGRRDGLEFIMQELSTQGEVP